MSVSDQRREMEQLIAQRDELDQKIDHLLCAAEGHPPNGLQIASAESATPVQVFCNCGEQRWVPSD